MPYMVRQGADVWFGESGSQREHRIRQESYEKRKCQDEFYKRHRRAVDKQMKQNAVLNARKRVETVRKDLLACRMFVPSMVREVERIASELDESMPEIDWDDSAELVHNWDTISSRAHSGTRDDGRNDEEMIAVDGKKIEAKTFPDGTPNLLDMPVPHVGQKHIDIMWCFDSMEELAVLYMVASHYRDTYPELRRNLIMPYVPNARMDRTKSATECFTLKYMCQMLNSLEFARVDVFDPHSDVTSALLNRVRVMSADDAVKNTCGIIWDRPDVVFYPDAGAAKRYGEILEGVPIAYGNKVRDWASGEIIGYDIVGDVSFDGKRVLIVDDISSYGGTFVHAAKALRERGATGVDLYVSHAERSCWKGKLFEDGGIGTLFTSDTLFEKDDLPEELRNRVVFVKRFRDVERGQRHPTADEMREIASV